MPSQRASQYRLADIPRRSELRYTERWNEPWMQAQRMVGDPLADAVIEDLRHRHPIRDPSDLLGVIKHLAHTEGGIYRDFMDACCYVPPWADFEKMKPAMRMVATHGFWQSISLLTGGVAGSAFYSTPEAVMAATGRIFMIDEIQDRMTETGAIVGLQAFPEEVKPGGKAHAVVMRVRVLHAAIRHWISLKTGDDAYDMASKGVPINQEDLAFASTLFSYINVRGMLRLGLDLSDEQIEAQHLLWRYICFVIGVDEAWLTDTIGEQKMLWMALVKHQGKPEEASPAALTLLEGLGNAVPVKPLKQFTTRTLENLTAYMAGEELLCGIQLHCDTSQPGLRAVRALARGYDRVLKLPFGEQVIHAIGKAGMYRQFSPADNFNYAMSEGLPQEKIRAELARQRARLQAVK